MSVQTTRPPAPEPGTRRRGAVFYAGLALVLGGIGILGYVAWQFFGTNVVAHHRQAQAVTDLRASWRAGAEGSPRRADGAAGTGGSGTVGAGAPVAADALIRIPAFGKDYVMPVAEGVDPDVLARGFGHFPGSAAAGRKGNYAVAAHRVTHGEPLRNMPQLRPGDTIEVETRTKVYTYRLDTDPNDLIVTFRDVWVVDAVPVNPHGGVGPSDDPRLITLTTCSELFHTDNRMIAFGHLVRTTPK